MERKLYNIQKRNLNTKTVDSFLNKCDVVPENVTTIKSIWCYYNLIVVTILYLFYIVNIKNKHYKRIRFTQILLYKDDEYLETGCCTKIRHEIRHQRWFADKCFSFQNCEFYFHRNETKTERKPKQNRNGIGKAARNRTGKTPFTMFILIFKVLLRKICTKKWCWLKTTTINFICLFDGEAEKMQLWFSKWGNPNSKKQYPSTQQHNITTQHNNSKTVSYFVKTSTLTAAADFVSILFLISKFN